MKFPVLRSQTRLMLLFLAVPLLVVLNAVLYQAGMTYLEGNPRTFTDSLEWSSETLTTTGYGADAHWEHPLMVLFVISVQLGGVFLVFLVFPIYLIPFLEERFEAKLPRSATNLKGHVIIVHCSAAVTSLAAELNAAGLTPLILEESEAVARKWFDRGLKILHGDFGGNLLESANLLEARAVIANAGDDTNAAIILHARFLGFEGPIFTLVEDPIHRRPMMVAGATAVYTPHHLLGAALAARASIILSPRLVGLQQLSRTLEFGEVRIRHRSQLAGLSLRESQIVTQTGATIVGIWFEGKLIAQPGPKTVLEPNSILVALGGKGSMARLATISGDAAPMRHVGHYVIGGYGRVGRKIAELLRAVDEELIVVDSEPGEGVDLVGDIRDPEILKQARVDESQAVILALDSDAATLFSVVMIKDFCKHVPVIARVDEPYNMDRIYRAGADFALSIGEVASDVLVRRLFGEDGVALGPQLKIRRFETGELAGENPLTLHIRERTGCSVVAVERKEEVVLSFDDRFRFRPDDAVYAVGDAKGLNLFKELFC